MLSLCLELNLLRSVDTNNDESESTTKSSSLLSSFRGSSSYNHETETIFALPRMQLDFKSIHVQDPEEPSLTGTFDKEKRVLLNLHCVVCYKVCILLIKMNSICILYYLALIKAVQRTEMHDLWNAM